MKNGLLVVLFIITYLPIASQHIDPSIYSLNQDLTKLIHKTHSERNKVLIPFYEWGIRHLDSVTIFTKIQKIDSLAQTNNDRELELEVELMRIHYYLYRDQFSNTLLIDKTIALNAIAKKEQFLWLDIWTLSLLGNYYFMNPKEYEVAFEYYEKAAVLLKNLTTEEFPLKPTCLHQLGWAYYYFRDYNQAIHYFTKSLNAHIHRANDFYYI